MKILNDFIDGLAFLGQLETKAASTLVHDTGKVTIFVNGKEVKVERFGKTQKEVIDGRK